MPIDHEGFLGRKLGNWLLEGVLHESGLSTIYWARSSDTLGQVGRSADAGYVVKVAEVGVHQACALQLLAKEARVLRQVANPHIVSVLDHAATESLAYLVMPRLSGVVRGEGVRPKAAQWQWGRLFWVARQVVAGLRALHRSGWTHGDLKPSHLAIDSSLHVTLIDLGLARPLADRLESGAGAGILGTPAYLAPEAFLDSTAVSPAGDVYALGVMLYQWLTGVLPITAGSLKSWRSSQLSQRPMPILQRVPELPVEVGQTIDRMLAKEPLRRPELDQVEAALIRGEVAGFAAWHGEQAAKAA